MSETQVLIVGAGPTGLAAASVLLRRGIRIRLIDKNFERSRHSKALGIQAGTLEACDRALGPEISRRLRREGREVREARIHLDHREALSVDLREIRSVYNGILILEQSETERIFEEDLARFSFRAERETDFIGLEERGSKVHSKVRHASGEVEEIVSDFVIGADGAHSSVRHALGLPFEGGSYTGDFILGDVRVDWPWPEESIRAFVAAEGVIAAFPLPDQGAYRLILIPKTEAATPPESGISFEDFRALVSRLSRDRIRVSEPRWLSRFRVHHRMVTDFQKGRVCLAGDAAHIHSPAGAQGMNTGIQDAFNLAFKLEAVLKGRTGFDSLRSYTQERAPVARQILKRTDFAFRMILLPENPLIAFARKNLAPRIIGRTWLQKRIVNVVAQLATARRDIAHYPETSASAPQ